MATMTPNIKKLNRNRVFRLIASCDKISKQDIASELSISLPTVTQNLNMLHEMGLIEDTGSFATNAAGRRARALSLVADARVAVGLDITRNHISLALLDLKGNIIKSIRKRMKTYIAPEYYKKLSDEIYAFIDSCGINRRVVLGVGISIPGIVYDNGTKIGEVSVINIDKNFYQIFQDYLDLPFQLFNDANAGGYAEYHFSHRSTDMTYLCLSNTIGGAIMMNGNIQHGANCRSAEFGHMVLVPNGSRCHCGRLGHADAYLCAGYLSQHTNDSLELFFDELEQNNQTCVEIFDGYLQNLAVLINNIRMCFDCDIVIGGYVGAHLEKYLPRLKELVKEHLTFAPTDADFISCCKMKFEASAVGDALYYIDRFTNEI